MNTSSTHWRSKRQVRNTPTVMSNICNGQQQQQQADKNKTVSLTPSISGNKMMISFIVLFAIVATLLESPTSIGANTATQAGSQPRLSEERDSVQPTRDRYLNYRRLRTTRGSSNMTTSSAPSRMQQSGPRKRPSQVSRVMKAANNQSKRIRSSLEEGETFVSRESAIVSSSNSTRSRNHHASNTFDDNNNNQIIAPIQDDNNNNNSISSTVYEMARTRQVSSLNGTIDLSRYEQDDVDRLYSDALLVYVKNFNETLPVRRETISIGGNRTSRIPIYRSDNRIGGTNNWPEA